MKNSSYNTNNDEFKRNKPKRAVTRITEIRRVSVGLSKDSKILFTRQLPFD
jgi:hypothetical protein